MKKIIHYRQAFFLAVGMVPSLALSAQKSTLEIQKSFEFPPKEKLALKISLTSDFSAEKDYAEIAADLRKRRKNLETLTGYQDQKREIDEILSYINEVVLECLPSATRELEKLKKQDRNVEDSLRGIEGCINIVFEFMTKNGDNDLATRLANMKIFVCPSLYSSPIPLSPLSFAAFRGNLDAVRMLVENGADVNQANDQGFTPFLAAARGNCSFPVFDYLIEKKLM